MAIEVERRRVEDRRTVGRRWAGATRPIGFDDRRQSSDRRTGTERRHRRRPGLRLLPAPELRPGREHLLERLYPAALLVILSVADVVTTRALQSRGGIEVNPVGRWLIGHGLLGQAKFAAIALLASLLVLARPRRWIPHALWFVGGIYTAVIGIHLAQLLT
jgi:hypothetical protein